MFVFLAIYVVTLPVPRPTIVVVPYLDKAVYAADVAFTLVIFAAAFSKRLRRPDRALVSVAMIPVGVVLASAAGRRLDASAWPDVFRVIYSMVVLVVVAHLRPHRAEVHRLVTVWVVWACALACASVVSQLGTVVLRWPASPLAAADPARGGVIRLSGPLEANAFILYLLISIALGLWLAASAETKQRRRRVLLLVLPLLIATPFTLSRGVAGLSATVALLARCANERLPRLWAWRLPLGGLAGILLACAVIASIWAVVPAGPTAAPYLDLSPRRDTRFVLHLAALRMLRCHPFTGVGLGRFGSELPRHSSAEERNGAWLPVRGDVDWDPHSTWFGWAAECGLWGPLAWALVYGFVGWRLLSRPAERFSLSAVAGCALVGIVIAGAQVEIVHLKFVWAFLGLALAAGHQGGS